MGQRVFATRDLWSDGKDYLLVLAGTFGTIVGFDAGDENVPPTHIVKFADGMCTYCTSDEICSI